MSVKQIISILNSKQLEIIQKLSNINSLALGDFSDHCYKPRSNKLLQSIYTFLQNYNPELEISFKELVSKTPGWKLLNDNNTWLCILIAITLTIKQKDRNLAKDGSILSLFTLATKYYSSLLYKYIRYCRPEISQFSFSQLKKTHLFSPMNSKIYDVITKQLDDQNLIRLNIKSIILNSKILSGLYYLSTVIYGKHLDKIRGLNIENDKEVIELCSKIIIEFRSRLNQSMKSYASSYYKHTKMGTLDNSSEFSGLDRDRSNILRQLIEKIVNNSKLYYSLSSERSKKITKATGVPAGLQAGFFTAAVKDHENYDIYRSLIEILLTDDKAYEILILKKRETIEEKEKREFLWIQYVLKQISARSRHNYRRLIIEIIVSDRTLSEKYSKSSEQYKRKMIVAFGLVIGFSVIDNVIH